jgi:hypothetical protein
MNENCWCGQVQFSQITAEKLAMIEQSLELWEITVIFCLERQKVCMQRNNFK